ncbi:hypothetical protein A2Y83_04925 [Candidatus Falkowbacteria bacterium RBG_13_39_14]|uniref:PEP-utilising enzyme mobile domain-containing protein n=1 Tax=Candidatus Falkowbacteria bacterium RBG_13_39_14 TaxID=1797985 RepID=A0A1F5S733_9BACT|nr:MAG: hypothetical protein A2Y83_04925 [Candidatus Falkowbacteria bacterium RBG_13_39_14]
MLKLALKYKTFDKAGKFLKKHSDKYQWICFDYVGPSHDYVYFAQRLKLLFKKPLNTLAADLQKITEKPKKIKLKTRNTAKKYNFPKSILKKIDALQDLIYIRDKKKEFFTEVHFNMEALLDKIQVLTKIEKKCLRWLTTKELIAAIKGNKIELKNIQKRVKYSAVLTKNGKTNILLSKKAKKYFDLVSPKIANIKHLKGMCGCSGKINGKVRVIGKIDDGYKLNKGEILVTTMTTIDFVPIIKKAAAIVTDEGGVTSHAAVISREFKIPSVIGTRIATQILKDGDLVEVDADKGIVKILK